ncbi:MAG: transglycosylase SLT domain-containing protein [Chitinophagaceae bacterium]|nr:transglycosylase SLT domain-containing protein [Chitinophagaceae bacterium]
MNRKTFFVALTAVWFSLLHIQLFANRKDSVTVITITDPSLIPKNAKYIKLDPATASGIDSSRFVKRKIKDDTEKPMTAGTINVNRSIYGTYTDFIVDYVKNYHKNHGNSLQRIQSNNKGYFKLIDNVMKRYSVPREMKSLAIIESAMNCNAVSPVGAVGPWQFMASTAKLLGLRVDQNIDERRDFYKSTHAAAKYLKQLYGMFHDWLLVIAAYNSGPSPVLRAINSGMGRSFWDIKAKLPKETQNHVMAFIATTSYLDRFSNVLNMGEIPKGAKAPKADFSSFGRSDEDDDEGVAENATPKLKFAQAELDQMAVLKVKGTYNLTTISRILDEDIVRLRRWNPDFDQTIAGSTTTVQLRIPIDKLEQFIISKDRIIMESRK